jgi:hypothetical protein
VPRDGGSPDSTIPGDSTTPPADSSSGADAEIPCLEASFEPTETQEILDQIPSNARYVHIKAWGAGANGEFNAPPFTTCGYDDSGLGGYSEALFEVHPGDSYLVVVGKRGRAGVSTDEEVIRFGFGHQGGGGLSGVFRGSTLISATDQARAMVIAGGGGGADVGPSGDPCRPGGTGNHPDSGGMSTMMGGEGLDDGVNGGGGGYYGGSGGPVGTAGKGGKGHVADDAIPDYTKVLYSERGSGLPPNTDDEDYDGVAGKGEQSGRVVIKFICALPPVL